MDRRFQMDLDGVLEYWLHVPDRSAWSDAVAVLRETLESSLIFYKEVQEAYSILHKVMFRAWCRRQDYNTDFAVSCYEMPFPVEVYLKLVDIFRGERYLERELYSVPPEMASEFAWELISAGAIYLTKVYFRACQSITEQSEYEQSMTRLFQKITRMDLPTIHTIAEPLLSCIFDYLYREKKNKYTNAPSAVIITRSKALKQVAEALLSCLYQDNIQIDMTSTLSLLISQLDDTLHLSADRSKRPYLDGPSTERPRKRHIPIKTEILSSDTQLTSAWKELRRKSRHSSDSALFHTQAFVLVCIRLRQHTRPMRPFWLRRNAAPTGVLLTSDQWCDLLQTMPVPTTEFEKHVYECKQWCLTTLRDSSGFWLSVLRLMVQYADLWQREWNLSYAQPFFADMIVHGGLVTDLYATLSRLSDAEQYLSTKTLCPLMLAVLQRISDIDQLQALRDSFYLQSPSPSKPMLGHVEYWSFDFDQLHRLCNQIDGSDLVEDEGSSGTFSQLVLLSTIWPFEVVERLVKIAWMSKDQGRLMVFVLKRMGSLCHIQHETLDVTLLVYVVNYMCEYLPTQIIEESITEIASFLKGCCCEESSDTSFSVQLESIPALLSTSELIQSILIPMIERYMAKATNPEPQADAAHDIALFQMSIHTFQELYQTSGDLEDWNQQIKTVLHRFGSMTMTGTALSNITLYFSQFLDIRNATRITPLGMSLHHVQIVYDILVVTKHVLMEFAKSSKAAAERVHTIVQPIMDSDTTDWRTRLFWQDLYTVVLGPCPMRVPSSVLSLVGHLDHVVSIEHDGENEAPFGRAYLADACKTSTAFVDALFSFENETPIVTLYTLPEWFTWLYEALDPRVSASVSCEYEHLLNDFVGRLYQSGGLSDLMSTAISTALSLSETLTPIMTRLGVQDRTLYASVYFATDLIRRAVTEMQDEPAATHMTMQCLRAVKSIWDKCKSNGLNQFQHLTPPSSSLSRLIREVLKDDTAVMANRVEDQNMSLDQVPPEVVATRVFFPFFDPADASARALALLLVSRLCELGPFIKHMDVLTKAVRLLLMELINELRDDERRQNFINAAKLQTKSTRIAWKKATTPKLVVQLRPILDPKEKGLLLQAIKTLDVDEISVISRYMDIASNNDTPQRKPSFMFITRTLARHETNETNE